MLSVTACKRKLRMLTRLTNNEVRAWNAGRPNMVFILDCYKDLVDSSPAPCLTMNPLYLSQPSIAGHTTLDNSLVRLDSSACTSIQNQSASVQTRSTAVSCDSLLWDTDHEREGKTRSVKESCDSLQWDSICQTKHQVNCLSDDAPKISMNWKFKAVYNVELLIWCQLLT